MTLTPGDHAFQSFEFTQHDYASTSVQLALLIKWFLRRFFFLNFSKFLKFPNYHPLEMGVFLIFHFFTTLNTHCLRMLCAKLEGSQPNDSGEDVESMKSLRTDKRTGRRQRGVIRKAQASLKHDYQSCFLVKL